MSREVLHRVLDALEVLERARFQAGVAPAQGAPWQHREAHHLAMSRPLRSDGLRLEVFRHAGISNGAVADALRARVLVVHLEAESDDWTTPVPWALFKSCAVGPVRDLVESSGDLEALFACTSHPSERPSVAVHVRMARIRVCCARCVAEGT